MILFKNATLFTPENEGTNDVLVAGGVIEAVGKHLDTGALNVEIVECEGRKIVPGFIDNHVHITGGGGEGGPASKVPPLHLSEFISGGITTAVGMLGTDGYTRSMKALVTKAKALKSEGLSVYVLSGSYQLPLKTLTGSVEDDMLMCEEIIGAGEIAISDHRSSVPTVQALSEVIARVHVGGLLSGKGGVVNVHVGSGTQGLSPLKDAAARIEAPVQKIVPTHINRTTTLLEEGIEYAKAYNAPIDFTAYMGSSNALSAHNALKKALDQGVDSTLLTLSSDAGGSLPVFDETGNLVSMGVGSVKSLHHGFKNACAAGVEPSTALKAITSNVAETYHLQSKGRIAKGYDADLLVLDANYDICDVIAGGRFMMKNHNIVKTGMFENNAEK